MPVVPVGRDKLFEALGRTYTEDEFQDLCFAYGIELDDVTTEKEIIRKEHAQQGGGDAAPDDADEEVLYKIDIPANRYDMLCLEGIARALNIFNGRLRDVKYRVADMAGGRPLRITVKPETALVRPFIVGAVLRGVTFDSTRYNSFIDLQDKLHQNLCRQRSLVSIGTHDLATLQPPFTYEALPPASINFVPLKQERSFRADHLLEHYLAHDQKLKRFVPIIQDSLVYPVVLDANRTVASLPPIINSAHSAITLQTRDVLIEATATDLTKAKVVLNTLCAMFSEYCAEQFVTEPVEVVDAFGQATVFPDLSSREMEVPVAAINSLLGTQLPAQQIAECLSRMALAGELVGGGGAVRVCVPPTRSDVLHACDVAEDVAIAHGYNNIAETIPQAVTVGSELPLNQLTELLRAEVAMAGYTEILTWALVSVAENFTALRRPNKVDTAVCIGNPATAEFEVCRTSLLPGALKTLGANKDQPLPVQLFDISDVVLLDPSTETGARNERRLVAVCCANASSFEIIHGLLNRVMEMLGVPVRLPGQDSNEGEAAKQEAKFGGCYTWKPSNDGTFFPGRQATIYARDKPVGQFGIIHPEVLAAFDILVPVSALELNLEPFAFDQRYRPLPTHLSDMQLEPLQLQTQQQRAAT